MKAADVMTPRVVSVRPDASVAEAARLMLERNISGLPVIDGGGKLVGIVTEGDLLRRAEIGTERHRPRWLKFLLGPGRMAAEYAHTHARRIEEVMTCEVVTVAEDTPLDEVVRLMERHRVKRMPIMRDGTVVGIVSRANLLHALAGIVGEVTPSTADDGAVRDRVLAEIEKQPWAPRACVDVTVRGGAAELWGTIFDDREREGLRVLVENVPGVKAVRDHLCCIEPVSGTVIDAPDEDVGRT